MLKKFMAGAVMLGIAGGAVAFYAPPAGKLIRGTRGADTLYAHAISGEPQIAQDYAAAGTGATGPNGKHCEQTTRVTPFRLPLALTSPDKHTTITSKQ